jgi:hypothetical protein
MLQIMWRHGAANWQEVREAEPAEFDSVQLPTRCRRWHTGHGAHPDPGAGVAGARACSLTRSSRHSRPRACPAVWLGPKRSRGSADIEPA